MLKPDQEHWQGLLRLGLTCLHSVAQVPVCKILGEEIDVLKDGGKCGWGRW